MKLKPKVLNVGECNSEEGGGKVVVGQAPPVGHLIKDLFPPRREDEGERLERCVIQDWLVQWSSAVGKDKRPSLEILACFQEAPPSRQVQGPCPTGHIDAGDL